jgi:hypothetical protein
MHFENRTDEYKWFACTSQRGVFGEKTAALRPIITPSMGTVLVNEFRIALNQEEIPIRDAHHAFYYQLHAIDYPAERERTTWELVEFRR